MFDNEMKTVKNNKPGERKNERKKERENVSGS